MSTDAKAVSRPASDAAVEERLEALLQHRDAIAESIRETAKHAAAKQRRSQCALATWIQRRATPENALDNPRSAAIFAPLAAEAEYGSLPRWRIDDAVGHQSLLFRTAPLETQLNAALILYPLSLAIGLGFSLLLFSWFIIPPFERMFEDFGLRLPVFSRVVIDISRAAREQAVYLGTAMVIGLLFGMLILWSIRRDQGGYPRVGFGWRWLQSRRQTWAYWTWHVRSLLDCGIPVDKAVRKAGNTAGYGWLQRISEHWSEQLRREGKPTPKGSVLGQQSRHFLANALIGDPSQRSELLSLSAKIDWSRDRNLYRWWLTWCTTLGFYVVLMTFALTVAAVALALFLPLTNLIGGLS